MPLAIPDCLRAALARPVAVFGAGTSGEGVQALLRTLGLPGVVYDQRAREFSRAAAARHGLVVFSPGFVPNHPWLVTACSAGLECLGELDFGSLFWRGRIVAITGTNGKTTLTEFLTHALRSHAESAFATGNIGRPFSRLAADTAGGAPGDIAVCETSSFQAETLQHFHADAALWINHAEDHLERHPSMEAYFSAKWNLLNHTAEDGVFVGSSVQAHARRLNRPLNATTWVKTDWQSADPRLAGTVFAEYPQRENFLMAAAWWRASGRDEEALYAAAKSFVLGRHRMTRVAEHEGVGFWNDSKATNFHAVEAALARFERPVLLIAGGKGKGGDLAAFVQRCAPRVRHLYLLGEVREQLAAACAAAGVPHTLCSSLAEAVSAAAAAAQAGDQVLLSPGFASFDQFRNYQDRGDQFERLVVELGVTTPLR